LEKERQELCAVLECTDRRFLTDHWKEQLAQSGGRAKLQQRVAMIETMLEN
jgi:coproporphyrinogen III oxidase